MEKLMKTLEKNIKNQEKALRASMRQIKIQEKQNAKLGDFGFAKALQGDAEGCSVYAKTYLGSPYYMSPEQCNG